MIGVKNCLVRKHGEGRFFEEIRVLDIPAKLKAVISHLDNLPDNENEVYLQQVVAPPQFHVNVRNFLDRTFCPTRIGRRESATELSPPCLDLTQLGLYLWGTLKSTV